MPVGNLVGAVAARPVSDEYTEWGWLLFSIGVLLWLALWPTNFRSVSTNTHVSHALRFRLKPCGARG